MSVIVAKELTTALTALREHGDARLIQGGTDLMVEINFNHV